MWHHGYQSFQVASLTRLELRDARVEETFQLLHMQMDVFLINLMNLHKGSYNLAQMVAKYQVAKQCPGCTATGATQP